MKRPTKKQLELLLILNPYIEKISYKDAAVVLGVSESAVKKRLKILKSRCPDVYGSFMSVRRKLNNGQTRVDNAVIIDPKHLKYFNILEKF